MIPTTTVEGIRVTWVPEHEDSAPFLRWVADKQLLGIDVETGGPDPLNPFVPGFEVRIISFASSDEAWVLHASHGEAIQMALGLDRILVAHNATFDTLAVRRHFGVEPGQVLDTFLLALLVYPPASVDEYDELALEDRHRLKPLSVMSGSTALRDADAVLHEWFEELEPRPRGGDQCGAVRQWEGRCFATCKAGDPRYWFYNGLDAVFCLRVLFWLLERWEGDRDDIRSLVTSESELGQLLTGITWRGLRVDRAALGVLFRAAVDGQEGLLPSFAELGVENPASALQVSAALEALGVVDPVRTGANLVSTDKAEGLPRLLGAEQPDGVRQLAGLLVEYRGHAKLRSKAHEISALVLAGDGHRVHPGLNALKARTGRMSIVRPALQNLPRKDQRIRAAFLAEEGYVLVGADFSQVEFRVAAALSEDEAMIEAILAGKDLHDNTAEKIFGTGFTVDQRSQAKNAGFAVQYGGGAARVAAMTGLSLRAATKLIESFFRAYRGLRRYIAKVSKNTLIELASGRRAAVDPSRTYANLNYYVQGTARDLFAAALLRLEAAGWADALWLVIHDEIILQVPEAQADVACTALETAMNTTFLGVPITAKAKILGGRWGKLPEPAPEATEEIHKEAA